jgi:hypothetical protein
MRELSSQHTLSMTQNEQISLATRFLYLRSLAAISLRIPWDLDAKGRCMQVLHDQQIIKSLPLKGMVGHALSFEQFLTHMLHQARAQARLRSLQERKYRTAARAAP